MNLHDTVHLLLADNGCSVHLGFVTGREVFCYLLL